MSAGQVNVPQRKLLAGPGQTAVNGPNTANNPSEAHGINMMDTYQPNVQKKSNRGGSRGVSPTNQQFAQMQQNN